MFSTSQQQQSSNIAGQIAGIPVLLTIDELAGILKRAPQSIRNDLKRNPDSLPKPFKLPGSSLLRWTQASVVEFLSRVAGVTIVVDGKRLSAAAAAREVTKPKRGRPTKEMELTKRQASSPMNGDFFAGQTPLPSSAAFQIQRKKMRS